MTRARDLADIADKDISGTLTIDDLTTSGDVTIAGDLSVTGSTTGVSSGNLSAVLTSGNTTGGVNIVFGDSSGASDDRLVFGAGSDLQIYHNASNSIIEDVGQGSLIIRSDGTAVALQVSSLNQVYATSTETQLRYAGGTKLATTSTGVDVKNVASGANAKLNITTESTGGGTSEILFSDNTTGRGRIYYDHGSSPEELHIETTGTDALVIDNSQNVSIPNGNLDVTGTVTADGLTLDNNGTIQFNDPQATDTILIGTNDNELIIRTDDGDIALKTNENKQALRVSNNGDLSLYEDTGTTAKLFWDASAEALGIGRTSLNIPLEVKGRSADGRFLRGTDNGGTDFVDIGHSGSEAFIDVTHSGGAYHDLAINTGGSEAMRIRSSGEMQLGGTTSAGFVDFDGTSLQLNTQRNPNTGAFVNTGKAHAGISLNGSNADSSIRFYTKDSNNSTGSERWRITKDGHFKAITNGLGIDFSATEGSGASSSVFDDYEEGTWTPYLARWSGGNISATYTNQTGRYTKIGRMVTLSFNITTSAISSQGSSLLYIGGLPYNNDASHNYMYAGTFGLRTAISSSTVATSIIKHSTNNSLLIREDNDFDANVSDNWLVGEMRGSITYEHG